MNTSESVVAITKALVAAKLKFAPVHKEKTNPAFRSKYADLGAYIDASEPALLANGILVIQALAVADPGMVQLSTRLQHVSGEWFECTACIPLPKQDPQAFGSAVSYLRRYSLASMLSLAAEDDDGGAGVPIAAPTPKPAPKATPSLSVEQAALVNSWEERLLLANTLDDIQAVTEDVAAAVKKDPALKTSQALSALRKLKEERMASVRAEVQP